MSGSSVTPAPPDGKKFIALCTPSLGTVSLDWALCLRQIQWPSNLGYIPFPIRDVNGNEIAECRNRAVMHVLQTASEGYDITHVFWLDDDVLCHPLAVKRLMGHGRDIASGVYFMKEDTPTPLIFPAKLGGTTPFVPNEVREIWGHGMGLTLVRTDVYRRMAKELSLHRDKYGNYEWYKTTEATMTEHAGKPMLDQGMTEDLYFLDLAATLGYRPVVDTSAAAFGWHLDSRTRQGYPREQWEQFRTGQQVVWQTPDGPKSW